MIPIKLSISGFLSYRQPVEIDFTSFDLACIAGANGAGKSSILDAITWALFGQARRRDDSIINLQSDTAEVSFTFSYEGNIYRVIRTNTRDKTTKLEFQISAVSQEKPEETNLPRVVNEGERISGSWKTLSERTLSATQSSIENTLRLDYETFVNAAFFLQGKADQFTQQRPNDRKRILASILGLEIWETFRERSVKNRKLVEADVISLDGRLVEIAAELAEEDSRKARLSELEQDLNMLTKSRSAQEIVLENVKKVTATLVEERKLVETLSQQLDASQQRVNDTTSRLFSRQKVKENHMDILQREDEIDTAYKSWCEASNKLTLWNEIAERFREHEKRRDAPRMAIETERVRLTQELESLNQQLANIQEVQASIINLQSSIPKYHASIQGIESEIEKRKTIETELITSQESLANIKAENPRLKAEMDELKSRIDKLREADGAACPLCGQTMSPDERSNLVDELTTLGKTMGDKFRVNKSLLEEVDDRVKELKQIVKSLSHLEDDLLEEKYKLNKAAAQIEQVQGQSDRWEKEGAPRLREIKLILDKESFSSEARTELALIDAELKEIGYDSSEHDSIRASYQDGRESEGDFHSLGKAKAALEPLENEIINLQSQINKQQSDLEKLQNEYDQAAVNLAAFETQAPDIEQVQRDLLDMQEQENQKRLEVGAARQKVLVLDDLKKRRKSFEGERENLTFKMGQYKQLERAFSKDGVPALLIESALPQIENKANDILGRLSGGTMSVQFLTQRAYKDKSRDDRMETLDIQISDNAGIRAYEMYSGGEAFRVNFAIRLALSEVLAQRAGARLQTLVIDEGFGSQDEVGRQRLIETINTVKPDFEKILVITHIDSMKEAFPTRIEVEKTHLGSVVNIQ